MKIQISPRWLRLLLLTLTFIMTACNEIELTPIAVTETPIVVTETPLAVTETAPTPTTILTEPPQGQAFVESLQVSVLESFPVQVQATIDGYLSNSCTSLGDTTVQQQGATFMIELETNYNTQVACTQALVPFTRMVSLTVEGLSAGTYTVAADGVSETFTLAVNNVPAATPDLGSATLTTAAVSAQVGEAVILTGSGFPPTTRVEIGIGPLQSEYVIIASTESGVDGRFTTQVPLPAYVEPGQAWVFVAVTNNATILADPLMIVAANDGGGVPGNEGVNVPVNGRFSRTYIYLVALEDGGQSGQLIGCNDSIIPIVIDIEPTIAPLTAALTRLLHLDDQYYGESGLYNALHQSDLTVQGINIVNRVATISLTGTLQAGGVCDNPRIVAQLEQTALQYTTIDSVSILLNGQPLSSQLSGEG